MGSPIAWFISWAITILSLCFAIISRWIDRKKKQLSTSRRVSSIISGGKTRPSKLKAQYDGKEIDSLTVTQLFIWNSCNTVIRSSDIAMSDPLRIICRETSEILESRIIKTSAEANGFKLIQEIGSEVTITFDYIEPGEGVMLQVLHTGTHKDLALNGTVIGGTAIRECDGARTRKETPGQVAWSIFWAMFPSILMIIAGIATTPLATLIESSLHQVPVLGKILGFVVFISIVAAAIFLGVKISKLVNRKTYREIPKSLL